MKARLLLASSLVLTLLALMHPAWAWENDSTDLANPTYGTHDWIAEHALDWLPAAEKTFILTYRSDYLRGTELPDCYKSEAPDCFGDRTRHHVYFFLNGSVQDDASAARAAQMQTWALGNLTSGDYATAAKWAGAMTHYISDLAVFGHVMGVETPWGDEQHHSDFEAYVKSRTSSYTSDYASTLVFDGTLVMTSAYDTALALAHDTTFDDSGGGHTALWMDQHYNWSDPVFTARAYQLINLAVNYVAEAVHAIWSTYVVTTTTTTTQQVTTSTSQTQTTTTSMSYHTTVTTTQSQVTTWITQTTQVASFVVGFAFVFIGIGAGAAAAALGVAVAVSGQSEVLAYGGYYYCRRHRVPVWSYSGYLWCPVERRYLRP